MFTKVQVSQLMQETLDGMFESGLIEQNLPVQDNLILLGTGSQLDSMAFVTFMTDLEDRLNRNGDNEIFLILTDIHDFNTEQFTLTADTLTQYILTLINGQANVDD